ncbi:MAG: elongation factor P [Candidatus Firestonebacteria bacterium GWA2_43_8]|nr:MAG: elongation factor P [Candidatus Firestonebacteria bacterium GWA2_43_8]
MIAASELRKGDVLKVNEELCMVVEVTNGVTAGRVGGVTKLKLKNVKTGSTQEKSCKQDEKFEEADLSKRKSEYLYRDGEKYAFMDSETYEQFSVDKSCLGKAADLLTEGMPVYTLCNGDELVTVQMPSTITVKVAATMPPMKTDSSGNMGKQATLETGAEIMVPNFIKEGDLVKVDTMTGEYIERISDSSFAKHEVHNIKEKKKEDRKK